MEGKIDSILETLKKLVTRVASIDSRLRTVERHTGYLAESQLREEVRKKYGQLFGQTFSAKGLHGLARLVQIPKAYPTSDLLSQAPELTDQDPDVLVQKANVGKICKHIREKRLPEKLAQLLLKEANNQDPTNQDLGRLLSDTLRRLKSEVEKSEGGKKEENDEDAEEEDDEGDENNASDPNKKKKVKCFLVCFVSIFF